MTQIPDDRDEYSSVDHSQGEVEHATRVRELAEAELDSKALARKETSALAWVRVMVFVLLVGTAVLVSWGVYVYTSNNEQKDFESNFATYAAKLVDAFNTAVEDKLVSTDALSVAITSHALSSGSTFPNVTLPNIEFFGSNARVGAQSSLIFWLPLVTNEARKGWEAYALKNQQQLMKSFEIEETQRAKQDSAYGVTPKRRLEDAMSFHDQIYDIQGHEVEPQGSGPFLVFWQSSPALPLVSLLNFNVMSHSAVAGSFSKVIESKQAVLDVASNQEHIQGDAQNQSGSIFDLALKLSQYRHIVSDFTFDPTSTMAYPVFDSFDENRTLAGVLTVNLYWSLYFKGILSTKARGIDVVLQNTLNQSFTYRIDGPNVTYLGPGDRHDRSYESLRVSTDVTSYLNRKASPLTMSYTTVSLNDEYCAYELNVYPSSGTEDEYTSNKPAIFTVVVAMVFVFTSLVFISYDWLVARRQRIVLDRAVTSGAIVSSLFPSAVRDKLYQEKTHRQKQDTQSKLSQGDTVMEISRPIADLYDRTTIVFADLAGFTKWSSTRTPAQVFELLETLYAAFDACADHRSVFKVETIGDCYVAVTGIPEPQEDHAVIMVKFARDILMKTSKVTIELGEKLGDDTKDLALRVGLHSGHVTAGVLRGRKGRFQLFGDTVNTASRMESTGVPGRIHISQATADELIKSGKRYWITQREDKVVAKGKGELQTYFVAIRDENTTRTALSSLEGSDLAQTDVDQECFTSTSKTLVSSVESRDFDLAQTDVDDNQECFTSKTLVSSVESRDLDEINDASVDGYTEQGVASTTETKISSFESSKIVQADVVDDIEERVTMRLSRNKAGSRADI